MSYPGSKTLSYTLIKNRKGYCEFVGEVSATTKEDEMGKASSTNGSEAECL
jgi:hypothetical protein